jgi:hypothetical protein
MNTPKTKFMIGAAIGLLVFAGLIAGLVYALSANPARTANLRDIIIIVLAFVTLLTNFLTGLLVAVLIYRAQALLGMVQTEVKPVLMQANQTMKVVRNTTTLVNENIARPAIRVASLLAGLRRGSKVAQHKISKRF